MAEISAAFELKKQAPDGNAAAGYVAYAIDANGHACVVDENGVVTYLATAAVAQDALTPSATATASLFTVTGFGNLYVEINAGAGSGAYTARYNLPDTGMLEGAIAEVNVDLPASANATVTFYDLGGAELAAITSPNGGTAVANFYLRFRFTAGAWICVARSQNI